MEVTRLSSKGQVVLPKHIRSAHKWGPGVEFAIEDTPDGVLLRPVRVFAPTRLDDVLGCTGYRGPTKTIEQMDAGIAAGAKAHDDRG